MFIIPIKLMTLSMDRRQNRGGINNNKTNELGQPTQCHLVERYDSLHYSMGMASTRIVIQYDGFMAHEQKQPHKSMKPTEGISSGYNI